VKLAYMSGRGSGRRALAKVMARDFAEERIARGDNPKSLITFVDQEGVKTATLESLIPKESP
jgi:hypothetical protein